MRIVMIHTFHHLRGGDATYALGLSEHLRRRGHEVIPFAMRHPDNEPSTWDRWFAPWMDYRDLARPRDRVRAALRFAWNRRAARCIDDLIATVRPDVVHAHHLHHHLTPSVLGPPRRRRVPVVWTVHDYELVCPNGLLFTQGAPCTACRGHRYHEAIARRCKRDELGPSALAAAENALHAALGVARRVDRFLCPSRHLADTLIDFGVPSDRVHHLPNFVDAPAAPPSTGRGAVFAGRLTLEKGLRTLLDAAERAPVPLAVCGAGPLEGEVRRRAERLPHVRVLGHLAPDLLDTELRGAAFAVVPSLWPENFPFAVTESQARGRAVIASRIGGIPEQIVHERDGLLVEPGDAGALAAAMTRLHEDPAFALRLGDAGAARVRAELDPDRHVDAVLEHYRELGAR